MLYFLWAKLINYLLFSSLFYISDCNEKLNLKGKPENQVSALSIRIDKEFAKGGNF
jgi:hypothetical protein